MAAIDLELRLERGNRGWGQERPEMMDNFDSEMQEWEDQLQDIQRKIEEVGFCRGMLEQVVPYRHGRINLAHIDMWNVEQNSFSF